jgi:WD40 repeat protein
MKEKLQAEAVKNLEANSAQMTILARTKSFTDSRILARIKSMSSFPVLNAVTEYNELSVKSYMYGEDDSWKMYISKWERDIKLQLHASLSAVIRTRNNWFADGCGVNIPGAFLGEILHHSKWAATKCEQFNGRTQLLKDMLDAFTRYNRSNLSLSGSGAADSSKSRRKLWASSSRRQLSSNNGSNDSFRGSGQTSARAGSNEDGKGSFDGISFALIGSSGSGKTSLMAKFGQLLYERENGTDKPLPTGSVRGDLVDDFGERLPPRPVIVRFCGSSAGSVSGLSLLCGIIAQLQHVLFPVVLSNLNSSPSKRRTTMTLNNSLLSPGKAASSPSRNGAADARQKTDNGWLHSLESLSYDAAVAVLHKLLHDHAVILLIDSIDQLSDEYLCRSRMSFLDGIQPHPRTRIIISALPDERDPATGGWLYCYQCHTRCRESRVPIIDVHAFQTGNMQEQAPEQKVSERRIKTTISAENGGSIKSTLVATDTLTVTAITAINDTTNEFMHILTKILASRQRILTPKQWGIVLHASTAEPTALYANLVAGIVEHWKSFDLETEDANPCTLAPTVKGLLHQTYDDLERRYGLRLTKTAIGLITFSVSGLTDNELEDLLSMDDAVLDSVFTYTHRKQTNKSYVSKLRRLPSHVWLRLRGAMHGLLVERTGGCLCWYHRQLHETAMSRYSSEERKHLHCLMGSYFSNIVPQALRDSRKIAQQPLTLTPGHIFLAKMSTLITVDPDSDSGLNAFDVLTNTSAASAASGVRDSEIRVNMRRITESLYHLVESELYVDFLHQIRDVELIFAIITWGNAFTLINYLALVESKLADQTTKPTSSDLHEVQRMVDHYLRWLRLDMTAIVLVPERALFSTVTGNQPVTSIARQDVLRFLASFNVKKDSGPKKEELVPFSDSAWIRCVVLSDRLTNSFGRGSFGSLSSLLRGHSSSVYSIDWSPKQKGVLVSGSADNSILFWDVHTGHILGKIEGHARAVRAVACSPDNLLVASGSKDGTVRVWDAGTGSQLLLFNGHSDSVRSLNWSPCGEYLLSGSGDGDARIWHCGSAQHDEPVAHSDLFFVKQKGQENEADWPTMKKFNHLQDYPSPCVHVLRAHSQAVMCCRWCPTGEYICLASMDHTISMWQLQFALIVLDDNDAGSASRQHSGPRHKITVSLINRIRNFSAGVFACAWNSASDMLFAGGTDGVLQLYSLQEADPQVVNEKFSVSWEHYASIPNGHMDHIASLSVDSSGELVLVGAYSGNVYIWNIMSRTLVFFTALHEIIYAAVFNKAGAGSPCELKCKDEAEGDQEGITFAVCSQSGNISVYNVKDGHLVSKTGSARSPAGANMIADAAVDVRTYRPLDTATATEHEMHGQLKTIEHEIICSVFTKAGDKLAYVSSRGELVVMDLLNGIKKFVKVVFGALCEHSGNDFNKCGHNKQIQPQEFVKNIQVVWSSSGSRLAVFGNTGMLLIVDGNNGLIYHQLDSTVRPGSVEVEGKRIIRACYWCQEDAVIVTIASDRLVQAWKVTGGEQIASHWIDGKDSKGNHSIQLAAFHVKTGSDCVHVAYQDMNNKGMIFVRPVVLSFGALTEEQEKSIECKPSLQSTVTFPPSPFQPQLLRIPKSKSSTTATTMLRIVFNNGGTRVAIGCADKRVYVWQVTPTEKDFVIVTAPVADVDSDLSSDAETDVEATTYFPLFTFCSHEHMVWALCFSSDDKKLYSGDRLGRICSWSMDGSREEQFPLQQYFMKDSSIGIYCCDFNTRNKFLACGCTNGSILLLNTDKFVPVTWFYLQKVYVRCVDMSPCGRWVVGGYGDGTIRVFDVETMDLYLELLQAHAHDVMAIEFGACRLDADASQHRDDYYMFYSCSYDGKVCCWQFDNFGRRGGRLVLPPQEPSVSLLWTLERPQAIRTFQLSPVDAATSKPAYIAFGGHGKQVEIVDLQSFSTVGVVALPNWAMKVSWNHLGSEVAVGCYSKDVHIIDINSMQSGCKLLAGHEESVYDVDWYHAADRVLSCSLDQTVRIWDPHSCQTIQVLRMSACAKTARASFDGSGLIVTAGADNVLRVWDAETGSCICELEDHTDTVFMAKFWNSSARPRIRRAAADDDHCRPQSVGNVNEVNSAVGSEERFCEDYSDQILSCSADGSIRIWDSVLR